MESLKKISEHKVFKFLSNRYVMILMLFLVWMVFFDENSFSTHSEIDQEIDKLNESNEFYKKEINNDKRVIKNLTNQDSLERYGREEYKMKKKDEDIFIIEFDTIKK